jgi:peptidoglycan/xylan/chitin deacetylase (PgdA/CDA1 family)
VNIKSILKSKMISLAANLETQPKRYDENLIVTLFHSIDNSGSQYSVSPEEFTKIIDYLVGNKTEWCSAQFLGNTDQRKLSERSMCITFDDALQSAYVPIVEMMERNCQCTLFVISNYPDDRSTKIMTWKQIKHLDSLNVEIGSHTLSHQHLPNISNIELRKELYDSKAKIEDILGKQVNTIAYPYGEFDRRVIDFSRDAGYTSGFTTQHIYAYNEHRPFIIPRFEPRSKIELEGLVQGRSHLFYKVLDYYFSARNKSISLQ